MSVWDVWDDLFDPSDEDIKKAYAEGVRDRDNADIIDQTLHGIGDDFPLGGRKEQARDAGWHDRDEGKVNWVRIDPTTPSTHSASVGVGYGLSESKSGFGNTILTIVGYMIAAPIYLVIGIFVLIFVIMVLLWIFLLLVAAFKALTGTL